MSDAHGDHTTPLRRASPGQRCVIVIGGDAPAQAVGDVLDGAGAAAAVVAADSGADHALALGLHVDLLIGDLDSVSDGAIADVRSAGGNVVAHPADKEATDTELALDAAVEAGYRRITVVSGGGGRLDHLLASLTVLAGASLPDDVDIDAIIGSAHVRVLRGPGTVTMDGRPGDLVSLVPLDAVVEGVTTEGLRWPLRGEPLRLGTSRGTSNEMLAGRCTVSATSGTALVVRPEALVTATDPRQPSPHEPGGPT